MLEEDGQFLLIDAGVSCRNLCKKIEEAGLSLSGLCGLLITHEHIDHIKGVEVFTRRIEVPVLASAATLEALRQKRQLSKQVQSLPLEEGVCIQVGGFCVEGFAAPHDAAGCFGFSIETPKKANMAIATDLGLLCENNFRRLQKAQLVAIEANYDDHMLKLSAYPASIKQRIRSKYGHLSNTDSAAAVVALVVGGLRKVVLCHLSADNNHPDRVMACLENTFSQSGHTCPPDCDIQIAPRHTKGRWMAFGEG